MFAEAYNTEYLWYKEKVFSGQQFLIPRFIVAIDNQRDLLKHNFGSEDLAAHTSQNGTIFEYQICKRMNVGGNSKSESFILREIHTF